jgi:HAD superfamily hydrolase (TIGR01459 family)
MRQFEELIDQFDAFLLDAYGVFWGSNAMGMLPGSAEAMKRLVDEGKQVGILSNSTQLSEKEQFKLAKAGVLQGVHYHFLLTSGQVAKEMIAEKNLPFATPRNSYYLSSPIHPRFPLELFIGSSYQETSVEEADFIYLSVPHIDGVDQEDPEKFREKVKELAKMQIPVLCANPDLFAHCGVPPRLMVRQGSIAKLFEEYGSRIYYIGKPERIVFDRALQLLKGRILMIGDTPETDIRGARAVGISSALVLKTGVMSERETYSDKPDFLIERFAL